MLNTFDLSTIDGAVSFTAMAHAGQTDKVGEPYVLHVLRVGSGLHRYGPDYVIAGLLHDVLEDTEWTSRDLLDLGANVDVVKAVESVTKTESERGVEAYRQSILKAATDPIGLVVKAADVADNVSRLDDDRMPESVRDRLVAKYAMATELVERLMLRRAGISLY